MSSCHEGCHLSEETSLSLEICSFNEISKCPLHYGPDQCDHFVEFKLAQKGDAPVFTHIVIYFKYLQNSTDNWATFVRESGHTGPDPITTFSENFTLHNFVSISLRLSIQSACLK